MLTTVHSIKAIICSWKFHTVICIKELYIYYYSDTKDVLRYQSVIHNLMI